MAKTKSRSNGEGSLYFDNSKKRWIGVVTIGYDMNDKPIRRKVSDKMQKECKKKLEELKEQIRKGTYTEKDSSRLEDIILFLIEKDKSLNIIKDNSYNRRKETLKIVQDSRIAKMPIQSINEADLITFFNTTTHYSQSNIKKIYGQINSAFTYAQTHSIIYVNPMMNIRVPKSEKETEKVYALTIDEQKRFINILQNEEKNHKYRYIFELMLLTGMRCGEINALDRFSDCNFNFKKITIRRTVTKDINDKPILGEVPKTVNGIRTVTMNTPCCNMLKTYLEEYWQENDANLLFYDFEKDKILTTNQVNTSFKRLIEKYRIIPFEEKFRKISEKNVKKLSFRKYAFYKKDGNEYQPMAKEPSDWKTNFNNYYYKDLIPQKRYNVHMLRHTFATRCIESGMPAKVLQKILGHADIETTLNTYCDVFEEYEDKALEAAEKYMNKLKLIG